MGRNRKPTAAIGPWPARAVRLPPAGIPYFPSDSTPPLPAGIRAAAAARRRRRQFKRAGAFAPALAGAWGWAAASRHRGYTCAVLAATAPLSSLTLPRPYLKHVKTPERRIFPSFCVDFPPCHTQSMTRRKIPLIGGKTSRHWTFRQIFKQGLIVTLSREEQNSSLTFF